MIDVSYRRHAKRINKKVQEKGAQGLIHGNTGRYPGNCISPEVKERVSDLSRDMYQGFNDHHFWEKLLVEDERVEIGRESVRKIRAEAGIAPKKKQRDHRHQGGASHGRFLLWF